MANATNEMLSVLAHDLRERGCTKCEVLTMIAKAALAMGLSAEDAKRIGWEFAEALASA